jgi:hypothetical protein
MHFVIRVEVFIDAGMLTEGKPANAAPWGEVVRIGLHLLVKAHNSG